MATFDLCTIALTFRALRDRRAAVGGGCAQFRRNVVERGDIHGVRAMKKGSPLFPMRRGFIVALLIAGQLACSGEVQHHPSALQAEALASPIPMYTAHPVQFQLAGGYERLIPERTEFIEVGRLKEGAVLRPTRHVLTVEGAHVHEAYLVVSDDTIVGFYLPVERAFSPLDHRVKVTFKRGE